MYTLHYLFKDVIVISHEPSAVVLFASCIHGRIILLCFEVLIDHPSSRIDNLP